jgi:hypothetical protein
MPVRLVGATSVWRPNLLQFCVFANFHNPPRPAVRCIPCSIPAVHEHFAHALDCEKAPLYSIRQFEGFDGLYLISNNDGTLVGKILFEKGKVSRLGDFVATAQAGDSTAILEELFTLLYLDANSPSKPPDIEKFLQSRELVAKITLEKFEATKIEERRIQITAANSKHSYIITIDRKEPRSVTLERIR